VGPLRIPGARRRDGLLKTEFKQPLGKVSYHVPCHGRVQNIGKKTEEMLKMIPGTSVTPTSAARAMPAPSA
jgi:glycerol-3-phosphate dehydrogenase subunit C